MAIGAGEAEKITKFSKNLKQLDSFYCVYA